MATSTEENYLKTIFALEEEKGAATVGDIGSQLGVTSGTVTTMMHSLSEKGLIDYAPRRGLKLSEQGRLSALRIVRRHRLIELFLVEVMKFDWSEVHEEAEDLEHVISDRFLDRMDEMLGHPTHDPHGDPIPDKDGKRAQDESVPLSDATEGYYRIVRVSDEDSSVLEWLSGKQVTIGGEFLLSCKDRAGGLLEIQRSGESPLQIGVDLARHLFVAPKQRRSPSASQ